MTTGEKIVQILENLIVAKIHQIEHGGTIGDKMQVNHLKDELAIAFDNQHLTVTTGDEDAPRTTGS